MMQLMLDTNHVTLVDHPQHSWSKYKHRAIDKRTFGIYTSMTVNAKRKEHSNSICVCRLVKSIGNLSRY